ncbi:MAG: GAF domain-containing protein [Gluconacetobacter diazotrophicus]|nr:GAF domain-containing protein [Gluconacetobacter diazotrophicus]
MQKGIGPLDGLRSYDLLDTPPERGFDDVVHLARQLCDAPIALVTLLDRDRQWFKARVGFPLCETDLDRSVCRFVVEKDELIEILDLTRDPRTSHNPLVTGDPFIRFYAGAPLRTRLGTIGALCVIDDKPRPAGLTAIQKSLLEMLARQVVDLIELRQRSLDFQAAEQARAIGEKRWRGLFRSMDEAFVLASAVRDAAGRIREWRHEEVNPAWSRMIGIDAADAIGRTSRELIPDLEADWFADGALALETGEPVRFTRQIGALRRWYDGTVQSVGDDRITTIFREVTDRVAVERRQEGLMALGDLLRDERDVAKMIRDASNIIGRALGASRAAYGELDHAIETVRVADGWEAPGMPPLAGVYRFDDYGRLRDTLLAGEPLVIADITTDPRTADDAAGWALLRARSVVNIPVREGGRTVALLLVHHERPHTWTADELVWLHNAADRIEVATARRRAEEQQAIINGEIAHRLKNTLATVQGIAAMTLRKVVAPEDLARFIERLQALARAHDLLHSGRWHASDLAVLVAGVLENAGVGERCRVSGPPVRLGARAAMSASLLLHELATNASKYGALSAPRGSVRIDWRIEPGRDGPELVLDWSEQDGPPVSAPTRKGFGSRLISLGLIGTGGSTLRYAETGLSASFRADAQKIEEA